MRQDRITAMADWLDTLPEGTLYRDDPGHAQFNDLGAEERMAVAAEMRSRANADFQHASDLEVEVLPKPERVRAALDRLKTDLEHADGETCLASTQDLSAILQIVEQFYDFEGLPDL